MKIQLSDCNEREDESSNNDRERQESDWIIAFQKQTSSVKETSRKLQKARKNAKQLDDAKNQDKEANQSNSRESERKFSNLHNKQSKGRSKNQRKLEDTDQDTRKKEMNNLEKINSIEAKWVEKGQLKSLMEQFNQAYKNKKDAKHYIKLKQSNWKKIKAKRLGKKWNQSRKATG